MTKQSVNVYDFDHTIYRGDASLDFIVFCLMRYPKTWKYMPGQFVAALRYIFGTATRKQVKEAAFAFLPELPDLGAVLAAFWDKHAKRLEQWYLDKRQESDIIVSASPEFLLQPIAQKVGIATVIATNMNPETGKIMGENCRGEEKVRRLQTHDATLIIGNFYSDSLADMPLFNRAEQPFMVQRGKVLPLAHYKPSKLQALKDPAFIRFLAVGGVNAFLGILFSYIIALLIDQPLLAYVLGYSISLVISYFLNAVVTFKEIRFSLRQFLSFCLSYVPNFIVVFSIVYVLVDIARLYSLVAYILAAIVAAPITFLLLSKFTFAKKGLR